MRTNAEDNPWTHFGLYIARNFESVINLFDSLAYHEATLDSVIQIGLESNFNRNCVFILLIFDPICQLCCLSDGFQE